MFSSHDGFLFLDQNDLQEVVKSYPALFLEGTCFPTLIDNNKLIGWLTSIVNKTKSLKGSNVKFISMKQHYFTPCLKLKAKVFQ